MATKLNTAAKIAIWAGVLATVGVSGWAFHRFVIKPWKAKRDAEKNQQDQDATVSETTTYTSGSSSGGTTGGIFGSGLGLGLGTSNIDEKAKSYTDLKKYFGNNATTYTDRLEKTLTYNGRQTNFKFYNNGRFFIYTMDPSSNKWILISRGDYSNGGKKLIIDYGSKSGQIKTNQDVLSNIKSAI